MQYLPGIRKYVVVVAFALACLSCTARSQDATVTFYNHGSKWKSGLPGTNHGVFYGCIYDGDVRLNCFRRDKFIAQIKFDRIAVYHLPPGPHVFAASYGKHPSKRSQLDLVLEPGKNYYLRAQSESRGVVEVEVEHGRLDPMTCEEALKETEKSTPLADDYFSAQGKAALTPVQAPPHCP